MAFCSPTQQTRFKHDLEDLRRSLADRFDDATYLSMDKYDLGAVYYGWDGDAVERLHAVRGVPPEHRDQLGLAQRSGTMRRSTGGEANRST